MPVTFLPFADAIVHPTSMRWHSTTLCGDSTFGVCCMTPGASSHQGLGRETPPWTIAFFWFECVRVGQKNFDDRKLSLSVAQPNSQNIFLQTASYFSASPILVPPTIYLFFSCFESLVRFVVEHPSLCTIPCALPLPPFRPWWQQHHNGACIILADEGSWHVRPPTHMAPSRTVCGKNQRAAAWCLHGTDLLAALFHTCLTPRVDFIFTDCSMEALLTCSWEAWRTGRAFVPICQQGLRPSTLSTCRGVSAPTYLPYWRSACGAPVLAPSST